MGSRKKDLEREDDGDRQDEADQHQDQHTCSGTGGDLKISDFRNKARSFPARFPIEFVMSGCYKMFCNEIHNGHCLTIALFAFYALDQ